MLIRPEEMKYLLKSLPVIKAAYESIKSELERLVENIDDSIYAACMSGSGSGGSVPSIGSISDKTGKIALKIQYSTRSDIKQLQRDINLIKTVIENIENSKKVLTYNQKLIVNHYYKDVSSWKDVIKELKEEQSVYFNERHIRRIFDYGIKQLIVAAQITIETYREVMAIMDGRGG